MFLTNQNARSINVDLQMLIRFRPERKSSDFPVYNSALIIAQVDCERRSHDKELEKNEPKNKNETMISPWVKMRLLSTKVKIPQLQFFS